MMDDDHEFPSQLALRRRSLIIPTDTLSVGRLVPIGEVSCTEDEGSNTSDEMLVGGHGDSNPNVNWLRSRGLWFAYSIGMLALHLIILCIPFVSIPVAWTVTNLIHNTLHFIFLHILKGAPWIPQDQGDCRRLTHWEQIDDGRQFTKTKKFLTAFPIILFLLTCFYTKNDPVHFYINFISLVLVVLPKLPQFHEVRLFGINKY